MVAPAILPPAFCASTSGGREPDQYDAWVVHVPNVGKPPEVLVFSEKNAALSIGHLHQVEVNGPPLKSLTAKTSCPAERKARTTAKSQLSSARNLIPALVGSHAVDTLMSDRIGGVEEARLNVFFGEPWISIQ